MSTEQPMPTAGDGPETMTVVDWVHHAGILFAKGEPAEAIVCINNAISQLADPHELLMTWGYDLLNGGHYPDAVVVFDCARARRPTDPTILHYLGRAWQSAGDPKKAVGFYREAIRNDGNNLEALAALVLLLVDQGEAHEAAIAAEHMYRVAPHSALALHCLGISLLALQRYEEAAEFLQHALTQSPTLSACWAALGIALQNLGRHGPAEACYLQGLLYEPGRQDCLEHLAELRARR